MRILPVFATVGLILMTGAAWAQTSIPPALPANPTPGASVPAAPGDASAVTDDTYICKYQVWTGTHFTDRVCRTRKAWKTMETAAQDYMEYGFRGAHQVDEGGGGTDRH